MRSALGDITDFAISVLDEMSTPAFPAEPVLDLLCRALDAPSGVVQRTRWRTGETTVQALGCSPADLVVMARAACDRRTEHPLMVAAARGDLGPSTCLRVVGAAAWQRHPVRDFLRDLHGWDQMAAVGLRGDGTEICGLAFARTGPDFTDEQLALLAAVQPLLQAVERHAARLAAWQARLDAAAPGRARDAGLTTREVEVLVLMSRGCTAGATARRLGCSPRTVEKHTGNLYRKLGVTDRLAAVLEGQRRRLLPLPRPGTAGSPADRPPAVSPVRS